MPTLSSSGTGSTFARLFGGLGNQLFIYAAAVEQAARLGTKVVLLAGAYGHGDSRTFDLGAFQHGAEVASFRDPTERIGASRLLGKRRRGTKNRGKVFQERDFAFDSRVSTIDTGDLLLGYFQSWRYFSETAEDVRSRIRTPAIEVPWLEEQRLRFAHLDRPIALHVRRGDYTNLDVQKTHGLTTPSYYRRAVSLLRELGYSGDLVLFSDAPADVSRELEHLGRLHVVDPAGSAYETLLLMSECNAIVTANSSFSWWAAWLGDSPKRTVLCPRPWFADPRLDTKDLLPPTWLTLDSREF